MIISRKISNNKNTFHSFRNPDIPGETTSLHMAEMYKLLREYIACFLSLNKIQLPFSRCENYMWKLFFAYIYVREWVEKLYYIHTDTDPG